MQQRATPEQQARPELEQQAKATLSEMAKEPAPAFDSMNEQGCIEVTAITSVRYESSAPPEAATGGVVDTDAHEAQHIVTVETNRDRGQIKLRASTQAQAEIGRAHV
jgi:hypothetical protein